MNDTTNNWHEVWAFFGYKVEPFRSAYGIVGDAGEEDDDSADYIYGWYQYVDRKNLGHVGFHGKPMREMGYNDAKAHFEGEIIPYEYGLND